ncbi:hypothetical protein SUGI_0199610 [Cryptomeria japonica]|uniref:uncharacterized protein LOC131065634 n=1 Tax=Cryptomeria japonica TaxID=3369 RepID=UPI002408E81C|nr:uncharacterized protein LOC131065634 [Cryptomeria japonica]GLJ12870.1 hypothetical protein SUGI_0199610 [Cryptomeria japonica]
MDNIEANQQQVTENDEITRSNEGLTPESSEAAQAPKRKGGRPTGSKNKLKHEVIMRQDKNAMYPDILEVEVDSDILECLVYFCKKHNAVVKVLSASGMVSGFLPLGFPGQPVKGVFELVGLTGDCSNSSCSLRACLHDNEGTVTGGMVRKLIAAGFVRVTIASIVNPCYHRLTQNSEEDGDGNVRLDSHSSNIISPRNPQYATEATALPYHFSSQVPWNDTGLSGDPRFRPQFPGNVYIRPAALTNINWQGAPPVGVPCTKRIPPSSSDVSSGVPSHDFIRRTASPMFSWGFPSNPPGLTASPMFSSGVPSSNLQVLTAAPRFSSGVPSSNLPGSTAPPMFGSGVPSSNLSGLTAPQMFGSGVPSSDLPGLTAPQMFGSEVPSSDLPGLTAPQVFSSRVPSSDLPRSPSPRVPPSYILPLPAPRGPSSGVPSSNLPGLHVPPLSVASPVFSSGVPGHDFTGRITSSSFQGETVSSMFSSDIRDLDSTRLTASPVFSSGYPGLDIARLTRSSNLAGITASPTVNYQIPLNRVSKQSTTLPNLTGSTASINSLSSETNSNTQATNTGSMRTNSSQAYGPLSSKS